MRQTDLIQIHLPAWLSDFIGHREIITEMRDRMQFVIAASRENVVQKTGGPFAAAIFEIESGRLISLGINLVATEKSSILHAEIVAILVAQKKLGRYKLGEIGMSQYELVTSSEPCAMCFGAIPWSGVSRVITGATEADVRAIGFDEGAKVDDWQAALLARQIEVVSEVEKDAAATVLKEYTEGGGAIYNGTLN
ncbi:MAG: nucleoside deaminase [Nitrospirota bacterium]